MQTANRFSLNASLLLAAAGLFGFLAVAIGAIGSHALKAHLTPDAMALFRTGWEYHMVHALALGLIGSLSLNYPNSRSFRFAGGFWILGILLFSGSLYAVSLGAPRMLVHVTPLGGFSLMGGWIALSIGALALRKH
jgi:uncharacterized membrane protein YgdD (TMEM256/DUF423 family)